VAGLFVLALVGTWVWLMRLAPPPPIPVPAKLGELDPQVRNYLARCAARAAEKPRDAGRRAELGLAFAVNGLWDEARRSFLDAVLLGDRGPLPGMYAAVALQELGDSVGSRKELEQVVEAHPDAGPAWYRLGVARVAAGDWTGAAEAFGRVTQLSPEEWRGWAGLGEVWLREGRRAEAIAPLEKAVALEPFARSAYHLLGQAYMAAGRTNEAMAIRAAGRATGVTPMPDAWATRALDHMRLLPDQFERVDALAAQGRWEEAVARMKEAHRYHPNHATVAARLARVMVGAGQMDAAWSVLAEARQKQPDDVELLTEASATAAAAGRGTDALALARRALEVAPHSVEASVAEANALLASEQDTAAAAALERALRMAPENVGLWIQLGDLRRHNLRKHDLAYAAYQRARELDPIHPPVWERWTELAIEGEDWEGAEAGLEALKRLQSDREVLAELKTALEEAKRKSTVRE